VPGTSFSVQLTEVASGAKEKDVVSLPSAGPTSALDTAEENGARCPDATSRRSQGPNSASNMAEERSASTGDVRRLRGGGHFIVRRMEVVSGVS